MNHHLQTFYSSFIYIEHDQIPEGYLGFHDDGIFFAISKEELNDKEIMLLNQLYSVKKQTPWMDYLLRGKALSGNDKIYTIIQILFDHDSSEIALWLETFTSFFDHYEDLFTYQDNLHVLIVETDLSSELDLYGILQTMAEDLGIYPSLYIGHHANPQEGLRDIFLEDVEIFLNSDVSQMINDYRNLYLPYYMREQVLKSYQLTNLREKILHIKDAYELVMTLWDNQGNITQTAQVLFLHRNTLNYRLDRFESEVGLSLRNLSDLQLCYFSII